MTRRFLTTAVTLIAACTGSLRTSQAQSFKVVKYNIGGDGGTDYLTAEPGTGRVFVSRGTHVMVDGATGKVLGDIPDTPRTHGIALAPKSGHGFITSGGDSTVTMFDIASRERLAHLDPGAAKWHLYEFDERHDALAQLDFADRGNIDTRLVRCPDEASTLDRFADSVHQVLGRLPECEVAVLSSAEVAFRWHGLEFARARVSHEPGSFPQRPGDCLRRRRRGARARREQRCRL